MYIYIFLRCRQIKKLLFKHYDYIYLSYSSPVKAILENLKWKYMKKEGRGEFQMKYMGIILFPYISIYFPAFSFSFKTNFS